MFVGCLFVCFVFWGGFFLFGFLGGGVSFLPVKRKTEINPD